MCILVEQGYKVYRVCAMCALQLILQEFHGRKMRQQHQTTTAAAAVAAAANSNSTVAHNSHFRSICKYLPVADFFTSGLLQMLSLSPDSRGLLSVNAVMPSLRLAPPHLITLTGNGWKLGIGGGGGGGKLSLTVLVDVEGDDDDAAAVLVDDCSALISQ